MVLVGLVGAIALSSILPYLGYLIRNRQQVSQPLLFLLLISWMIFNLIGHVSGIWAYRFVSLDVYTTTFVIMAPIMFFTVATTTLIPQNHPDHVPVNLEEVYWASSKSVYVLLALHTASALAADYLPGVTGAPPALFMASMTAILLLAAFTRHKGLHVVLLVVIIALQALPPVIPPL